MMEVKGTSVRGTYEFVKKNFPNQFEEWKNQLPVHSRELMNDHTLSNKWYPLDEGLIIPIELISRMFYNNDMQNAAFIMGSYHANLSLGGIYKFFVRLNSPRYIIEKGVEVFNTYFRPTKINIETHNANSVIIHIYEYEKPHIIFESSIEGWTKKAIEISGGKNVQSQITKSLTRNEDCTDIVFYWE